MCTFTNNTHPPRSSPHDSLILCEVTFPRHVLVSKTIYKERTLRVCEHLFKAETCLFIGTQSATTTKTSNLITSCNFLNKLQLSHCAKHISSRQTLCSRKFIKVNLFSFLEIVFFLSRKLTCKQSVTSWTL